MKLTPPGSILALPRVARPRLLSTLAGTIALALTASVISLAIAPPTSASVMPAPGATAYGNDLSWPQCPKGKGGYGLPGPMRNATFAILGLTNGGSFRANPCLASQVASVKARHLWAGAYAIATYPSAAQLARYGGTGTLPTRLRRVGAAEARFNIATMARVGLRAPLIWVDIEPRVKSPWSTNIADNNSVIDGVIARYKAAGLRVGIYSYGRAWHSITGDRIMPGIPTWVPVGHKGRAVARATCALPSYAGQKPRLTQWTDGVRDYNVLCPGVTGVAASGNLLTPYLNVRLSLGSRGDAVKVLQRRLGRVKVDGSFGAKTRARVITLQRARHLTPNGIAGRAVWRELGAGTGTYTPPVPGIMRAIFRST